MKTISAFAAKTHFGQLLKEVEKGESFEILRHNVPVARLVGTGGESGAEKFAESLRRIRKIRSSLSIKMSEINQWVQEGRR